MSPVQITSLEAFQDHYYYPKLVQQARIGDAGGLLFDYDKGIIGDKPEEATINGQPYLGIVGVCYYFKDLGEYTIPLEGNKVLVYATNSLNPSWELFEGEEDSEQDYQDPRNEYCYDYPSVPKELLIQVGLLEKEENE